MSRYRKSHDFLTNYQLFIQETARVKAKYWYACLGLAGEVGEVIEVVKKLVRDSDSKMTPEIREKIKLELGDVLWYAGRLMGELDLTFREVIEANIDKLTDRKLHGKVTG